MTDMTDRAIQWVQYTKSVAPQKPFVLYFAPGAAHAPHQVAAEWREKYKGQFDKGWDVVRQETCDRQLQLGVVPPGTKCTPRAGLGEGLGHADAGSKAPVRAADGKLRRISLLRRSRDRPLC